MVLLKTQPTEGDLEMCNNRQSETVQSDDITFEFVPRKQIEENPMVSDKTEFTRLCVLINGVLVSNWVEGKPKLNLNLTEEEIKFFKLPNNLRVLNRLLNPAGFNVKIEAQGMRGEESEVANAYSA